MPVINEREPVRLLGKYVNFDDKQLTGQVVFLMGDLAQVIYNWQELDLWRTETLRDKNVYKTHLWPIFQPEYFKHHEIQYLVSEVPKYPLQGVALLPRPCIIQSHTNQSAGYAKHPPTSSTPLRERSGSSQEIEIMAKTAVFDSENVLIKVYDSKKEAKAANKGDDLKFIDAKSFPEGGIGEYETVDALFPPKEAPKKAEGEAKTRTVVKREGGYTVVKADGARFEEGDERGQLHTALMNSTTVEEYLEKAPKEAKFVSSRGADQSVTASGYMSYAFKRGWITQGEVAAPEVVVEE